MRMRWYQRVGGRSQAGMAAETCQHPLLQQLSGERPPLPPSRLQTSCFLSPGVIHRLKTAPQPIRDGQLHLIPFCETLELVFRHGLKRQSVCVCETELELELAVSSAEPNSWFGLNKQDYWSWIEPLQDYYFNEK